MCEVCNNLKGKAVLDKGIYYEGLEIITSMKANTNTPTFKVDKDSGEGKATKDELKYRQDLQDLIKEVWKVRQDKTDSQIHDLINKLFVDEKSKGKQIATDFINNVYTANADALVAKLKEEGIETKVPKKTPIKDALMDWQLFAVEKIGIELELGIKNERLGKRYFEAAYGNPDKA